MSEPANSQAALLLLSCIAANNALALPSLQTKATNITAEFQAYELDQCNLGTTPLTSVQTTLDDGTCRTFFPASLAYIPGYQTYRAMLNEPVPVGDDCALVFYEENACGSLGEATNGVPVPTSFSDCEPITLDTLGTAISNGVRSVLMTCDNGVD
ncbi:hypothetical protein MMC20_001131 [Loxospora ochrophaea]|nr:hypothetical protein [Loxospora ochrophaea]